MTIKLGVVMDPISTINFKKDSTLAMLLEGQARGYQQFHILQNHIFIEQNTPHASMQPLKVYPDPTCWYALGPAEEHALETLDVILMRKDPPFDMNYIYTTYMLELAEQRGVLVINRPQSLRDANEKLFTCYFPRCMPPTLVSSQKAKLFEFLAKQGDIILKPLEGMGGASIFRVRQDDPNINVIIETLTLHGSKPIMAQRYLPEIAAGDKRILLIDGEAVPYALARKPAKGETRANLATGGTGVGVELSERDRWICQQVAPVLKERGLAFVGLDVIGDYLTEINVTSPTCIRELDSLYGLNISAGLFDHIEARLA